MPATQKVEFRIVSQAFDSWNVQFRIDVAELLDQESLLTHLRSIKSELGEKFTVPENHMIFDGILRKVRTDEYVDVVVRIKQRAFEKGNPEVNFQDGVAEDGTSFSKMKALLNIYYLDAFDKPIMLDRVSSAIRDASVAEHIVDKSLVSAKLQEVLEKQKPVKDIQIAQGVFSDIGNDASVEFFFQAMAEPGKTDEYFSSRRVKPGDILCKLTPATYGEKSGHNVIGEELPPRKGFDIELEADTGVALSFDGNEAVAEDDGVVVITRDMERVKTINGAKEFPRKIHVKVNPVLRVEGDRVLDVEASKTVEVIGNLCMGSKILTDCEVYVTGDIEAGSTIEAGSDVIVEGNIDGATVNSDTNVIAQSDVKNASLSAKEQLIIKGRVKNSELQGDEITANEVSGSKVVARTKATFEKIDADEDNVLSTICVGMTDFFEQRIQDNEQFIQKARENLARIEIVIGEDIMEQVNMGNVQNMLLKVLARNRIGLDHESKKQAAIYRKLIESVPPTKAMLKQKEFENQELRKKLRDKESEGDNIVVIKEQMKSRTVVSIDGVEAEVPPVNGPAEIQSDGRENIIVHHSGKRESEE